VDPAEFFDALALVPNWRTATFNDMEMKPQAERLPFPVTPPSSTRKPSSATSPGRTRHRVGRSAARSGRCSSTTRTSRSRSSTTRTACSRPRGAKRLKLAEDTKGLAVDADLPDTSLARDLFALVEATSSTGCRSGSSPARRTTGRAPQNGRHRTLLGFKKLLDVTATWNPTYRGAEAQFRSMTMQYVDSPESLQQLLMGAYPQLQEQGIDGRGTGEEETPADDETPPDGADEPVSGEGEESGVAEQRTRRCRSQRGDAPCPCTCSRTEESHET
jgi:hypothetical protein